MRFYSIQAVSQMCGLSSHCIRAWEKRYGAISPERSENGRRLYSEKELNRLVMLGKLSSLGNTIRLIANLPDEELEKLLGKMSQGANIPQVLSPSKSLVSAQTYLMNMFMALNSYKLDILTHELEKASMDLSCKEFALDLIAALFRKVGEYVRSGKMSIAQEHTLSAITKFFIGRRIGMHYRVEHKNRPKILLATPIGEHHSIGLLLASLLMAEHGLNFVYLGENLPEETIAEAASATGSSIVLLAVAPSYTFKSRDVNDVLINLRQNLAKETQIWVGGSIAQVKQNTIRDTQVITLNCLSALDAKLAELA